MIDTIDSTSKSPLRSSEHFQNLGEFGDGKIIVEKIVPHNTTKRISNIITKEIENLKINGITIEKISHGNLILSKNLLICGKNKYPYDKIIGISRSDKLLKSVHVTLETTHKRKKYQMILELRTDNSDSLFRKLNEIILTDKESGLSKGSLKDQKDFIKDRLGIKRF